MLCEMVGYSTAAVVVGEKKVYYYLIKSKMEIRDCYNKKLSFIVSF